MEFLSNPTPLIKLETIFGAFFYLIGVLGSYYRFKLHKRREKIDALCMICMTWGAAAITVSIGWIIKHTAVPSLHFELYRFLWYAGAFVTSMVFLTKDFKSAFIRTRLGANLLLASMILVFFDALVFYFTLPLEAAVCSCIGVVIFFIANLFQKKNIAYLGRAIL